MSNKDLIKVIGAFQDSMKRYLPEIKSNVNWIINNKSTDVRLIESHLDTLLNLRDIGLGKNEFHKLNDYYVGVNPENANEYEGFYAKDL